MTSIEWLIEQMFKQGYFDGNKPLTFTNLDHLQQQAKEMHKIELGKTWDSALDKYEVRAGNYMRAYEDFDDYYQDTFVSKGSGMSEKPNNHIDRTCGHTNCREVCPECQLTQQEISDEEIEKAAMDSMDYVYLNPNDSLIFHQGWMRAIKWYREQLKQKK
jgi:hypothetical protein